MGTSAKITNVAEAVAAAGALLVSQLVLAQTPQSAAPAAAQDELQEVVVTAQRRVQTVQTTPIAITVFSAEDITRKGIVDIQSLTTNDTSLNFSYGAGGAET